jgi:hypothetical protein
MGLRADMLTDLDTIYNDDDFAVEATLADGTKINVILRVNRSDTFGIENAGILMSGKYADLSECVQRDTIIIGGTTYYLLESPQNTGTGRTTIKLSQNSP